VATRLEVVVSFIFSLAFVFHAHCTRTFLNHNISLWAFHNIVIVWHTMYSYSMFPLYIILICFVALRLQRVYFHPVSFTFYYDIPRFDVFINCTHPHTRISHYTREGQIRYKMIFLRDIQFLIFFPVELKLWINYSFHCSVVCTCTTQIILNGRNKKYKY